LLLLRKEEGWMLLDAITSPIQTTSAVVLCNITAELIKNVSKPYVHYYMSGWLRLRRDGKVAALATLVSHTLHAFDLVYSLGGMVMEVI
jgi:hypothetical protein